MEPLTALVFSVVLDGLWDARNYEPPVPEYSTSDDWYSAELECTETGFAYPGVFASEFEETMQLAERELCIEGKLTETAVERDKVQTQVSEINKQIQELIEQRKSILKDT
jgi:hypothetical protein